ncbi:MAG: DDE-type integrase/transposase/recombinase [Candidatus Saccharibacteria bacterium]|nr:DDE-type integrase/transposase/recombinase [Candidatus Saccharibacteria bacterium]MDO5452097.1 DDE-type integrase/transposase/recombinase [Candidatus Saccharibacteria bacterium]
MAYYTGKDIEKSRGNAMKEVILEKRSIAQVARRFGKSRSTIYRWKKKWEVQQTVLLENPGRPSRALGKVFRWQYVKWDIPTLSSAPKTHPNALDAEIVAAIMRVRRYKYECAEIVQYKLQKEGIMVSLSSVKRTIKRNELWRKKRRYRFNEKRPLPTAPGKLVQIDTVHYVNPLDHSKMYIYTVIDLYTRMAYAKISPKLSEKGATETILEAQEFMGFSFKMVQSDNGAEFQTHFQGWLNGKGIKTRHTRVRHPNDDAHIERFNRTLRKECIGQYNPNKTIDFIERKLKRFINYYNYDRIHLGIGLKTPYEVLQRW